MCRCVRFRWVVAWLAALGMGHAAFGAQAQVKNIIILVADGGGFNIYRAADYYQYGRLGCQVYDGPEWVKYASRTAPLQKSSGSDYGSGSDNKDGYDSLATWDPRVEGSYARALSAGVSFKGYTELKRGPTDSAAGATAMAGGYKTDNGRINTGGSSYSSSGYSSSSAYSSSSGYSSSSDSSSSPYSSSSSSYSSSSSKRTITELAKASGRSTGVVSSVQWSDATPACFGAAHASSRTQRRDIANEMLSAGVLDVIMGTGHPEYDANGAPREPKSESDYDAIGGSLVWELLRSGRHTGGWKLIETKAQFEALVRGETPAKVLGIPRITNTLQQERQTRDWNRDGKVEAADAKLAPPYGDPLVKTVPGLPTMARGALNVLSKNRKGFFVMIEGGAVDKGGHANQPGRQIEEQVEFNRTIEAVVEWVEKNSNWQETLLIITADHETGLLWGINSDMRAFDPLMNRGIKRTPGMWYNTGGHTNSLVPLKARGAAAKLFASRVVATDPVYGPYVDNTSVFEVMKAALEGSGSESRSSGGGWQSSTPSGVDSQDMGPDMQDSPRQGGELMYDSAGSGATKSND